MTHSEQCLIVPMQAQALCVGEEESEQKGDYFSPPTATFLTIPTKDSPGPYISGPCLSKPFQTDTSPGKGVHLHWFLPDALTHARSEADDDGTMLFPVVPNRWLVARVLMKNGASTETDAHSRAWVVESDFLSTDDRYHASANIPFSDPTTPYRYMGRALPLEQWRNAAGAERFERLTALGYGDPAFSIYYPNCKNVFAFHDSLEMDNLPLDEASAPVRLSYIIVGWYGTLTDDPIGTAFQAGNTEALLRQFKWGVDAGAADGLTRTLCCSMITNVLWSPEGKYIRRRLKASVGIGNTVSGGLSALLAGMAGGRAGGKTENALEALQAGRLNQLDHVDALADLTRATHKNSFSPESGGALWCIVASVDGQDVSTQMDPAIVAQLDALNRQQVQFNSQLHDVDALRKQAFLDWYKYMLFKYDPDTGQALADDGIDAQRFKDYISPDEGIAGVLADRQAEISRLSDTLHEKIHQLGCELSLKAAPRFYRPNDPVVLLAGNGLKPTMKHAPDQTLPCIPDNRLLGREDVKALFDEIGQPMPGPLELILDDETFPQGLLRVVNELYYLDSAQALAIAPVAQGDESADSPGELKKRLNQILKTRSAFYSTAISGVTPAAMAIRAWVRPWNPLYMHWRVEYQPIRSDVDDQSGLRRFPQELITSRFKLSAQSIDLNETQSSKQKYESYEGVTILSPNVVRNFEDVATVFLSESGDHGQIGTAHEKLRKTPVLAQALSGFHDALIMRQEQMQFPIDDPLDDAESDFHARMRTFVGGLNPRAPTPNKYFNPVRVGRLKIDKIRVVDTFGQYREVAPETIFAAQNLVSKSNAKTDIFLPPRLVQPARLTMRWLGDEESSRTMDRYRISSPVCGWLVPNFLDQSLMIYDAGGDPVGIVRSWEKVRTIFRSYPGRTPEFAVHLSDQGAAGLREALEAVVPGNACLQHFVAGMVEKDAAYLKAFIHTLDQALGDVAPDGAAQSNLSALLSGRPVALLRVGLNLELKGLPAVNQSWSSLVHDLLGEPGSDSERDSAGFTAVRFPVRLGSPRAFNEYNDGLIGFFKACDDEREGYGDAFYTYHGDGSNDAIVEPTDATIQVTADKAAPPVTLLVLMDPRARLYATSGILPKKHLEIPAAHFEKFYGSLETTFLTSPVLHHREVRDLEGEAGIDLPLASDGGAQWRWIAKEGDVWQDKKIFSRAEKVATSTELTIGEGWLRLQAISK